MATAVAVGVGLSLGIFVTPLVSAPTSQGRTHVPPQPRVALVDPEGVKSIDRQREEIEHDLAVQAEKKRQLEIEAEERRREIAEAKRIQLASRSSDKAVTNDTRSTKEEEKPVSRASGGHNGDSSGAIRVESTAYTAFCDTGCTGVTATGVDVSGTIYYQGRRIIAVDPAIIPLYSIVRITFANGTSFEAIALDTGGAIKGHKIDLLVGSKDEAWAHGRQSLQLEILK